MAELRDGESIEFEGDSGTYIIARRLGIYSCTCPSWKRSKGSPGDRTCKHLRQFWRDPETKGYIVRAREDAKILAAEMKQFSKALRRVRAESSNHPQVIEDPAQIEAAIDQLSKSHRLWLDTEVADFRTKTPRLSLIQAMQQECEHIPENVVVLDVLHYPELIQLFEQKIMGARSIEKVFHRASYDMQFLSTSGVESVFCTWLTAKRLKGENCNLPRAYSLKALAEHFQLAEDVDKTEQAGDWGERPLSPQQVEYAVNDILYLRGIDSHLRALMTGSDKILSMWKPTLPPQSKKMRVDQSLTIESKHPQNVPADVRVTWHLFSKGGMSIPELVKLKGSKLKGSKPKVYNHLATAILHGLSIDMRRIVNSNNERTLAEIWRMLPPNERTPERLRVSSRLRLPIGVFNCVAAFFQKTGAPSAAVNSEPQTPAKIALSRSSNLRKSLAKVGALQRSARIPTKAVIRLTGEQAQVLNSFRDQKNLKVHAFAGAGKTQTLVEAGSSTTRKGLYLSFNSKNAEEAKSRFPSRVACMTTHGLAFRKMRDDYATSKLSESITVEAIRHALSLSNLILDRRWSSYEIATLTLGMLRDWLRTSEETLAKASLPTAMALSACSVADRIELEQHCRKHAARCWQIMTSSSDAIPLSHDGYLKLWAMSHPVIEADYIMIDEAQDSNSIILDVIARQPSQKIMVGDRHQQIYEWRGAIDAMTRLHADEELFLTNTFRFGDEIASYANSVLHYLNEPKRVQTCGDQSSRSVTSGLKAFLARTNAAVIEEMMCRVDAGVRVHVQGGTQEMERLIGGIRELQHGGPGRVVELIGISSFEELKANVILDEHHDLAVIVKLVEQFGADKLLDCAKKTVREGDCPDLVLSTVHKAKGLEWDSVELSADLMTRLPEKDWNTAHLQHSELRLLYVALTRAKRELILPEQIRRFLSPRY